MGKVMAPASAFLPHQTWVRAAWKKQGLRPVDAENPTCLVRSTSTPEFRFTAVAWGGPQGRGTLGSLTVENWLIYFLGPHFKREGHCQAGGSDTKCPGWWTEIQVRVKAAGSETKDYFQFTVSQSLSTGEGGSGLSVSEVGWFCSSMENFPTSCAVSPTAALKTT